MRLPRVKLNLLLVFSLPILVFTEPCFCDEPERENLLGDWGGKRSAWEEQGISFEGILTHDAVSNVSGGIDHTTGVLGNVDLTATLDTSKLGWWENGTFFTYFLGNYGRNPTEYVGDLQTSDNIEAYDTFKLYEAWYEHSVADGSLSLLVGLHDYNSEFDTLDYAGTLINSSFGISVDISQVGPSIFPTTSLAARLRLNLTDWWYLQTALYDGVPGDPNNPRGTRIRLRGSDGIFYAGESGYLSPEGERHMKAALGGWYHSAEFEDFRGNERDKNSGLYFIAEALVLAEDDEEQGLGLFFQSGFTESDRNQISRYFGTGFSYTGLIPSRDEDVFSLGIAIARNGHEFREEYSEVDLAEVATELTYRIALLPYISLQPDIQFIANPSTDPGLKDAWVLGLRTEIGL